MKIKCNIMYVDITDECNYSCSYCNAYIKKTNGDINRAFKLYNIMKLRKFDINIIVVTGGEPSIYRYEYNDRLIKNLRKYSNKIIYMSNMSGSKDFYVSLDVDEYIFSYHPSEIDFSEFKNKFIDIIKDKSECLLRVAEGVNIDDSGIEDKISRFKIRGINDKNLLFDLDNMYQLSNNLLYKIED